MKLYLATPLQFVPSKKNYQNKLQGDHYITRVIQITNLYKNTITKLNIKLFFNI